LSTVTIAVTALSASAFVWLFLRLGAAEREGARLSRSVVQLEDSIAVLAGAVDSLEARRPGLGEYMSTIQLHAAKLWFAGQAGNWGLVRYELDELGETIEAAEALHTTKNSVNVTAVLRSVREGQLPLFDRAVAAKDLKAFDTVYDETLEACNGCHRPAGYEFIHITRPGREPVTNQRWKPSGR
jgi:hypothetical protein